MTAPAPPVQPEERPRRLLRFTRAAAAMGMFLLLVLMAVHYGVEVAWVRTPAGSIGVALGDGKVSCLTEHAPAPWDFGVEVGERHNGANNPAIFLDWPRIASYSLPGVMYSRGTFVGTQTPGVAVSVSYWYVVLLFALLFGLCHWRLRAEKNTTR